MSATLTALSFTLATLLGQSLPDPELVGSNIALNEYDASKLVFCQGVRPVSPRHSSRFWPCQGVQLERMDWKEFYLMTGHSEVVDAIDRLEERKDFWGWSSLGLAGSGAVMLASAFAVDDSDMALGLSVGGASIVATGLTAAVVSWIWPHEHDVNAIEDYAESYNLALRDELNLGVRVPDELAKAILEPRDILEIQYVAKKDLHSPIHHDYVVVQGQHPIGWDALYKELGEPVELAHITRNRTLEPVTKWVGYMLLFTGATVSGLATMELDSPWIRQSVGVSTLVAGVVSLGYSLLLETSPSPSTLQPWLDRTNEQH